MFGILNFMNDIDNYGERKIDRYDGDGFCIDTCAVSDGEKPYETGIKHPEYNEGYWIIVEAYDTPLAAKNGHNRWVEIMTDKQLPDSLKDCGNAEISQLLEEVGGTMEFPRKEEK